MKTEDNKKTSQDKGNSPKKSQAQEKGTKSQDLLATLMGLGGNEDGEKKPKKRPYLHFKEFGLVIPFWAIVSVEKSQEMLMRSGKYVWVHEIIINRGMESSPNMPFGERVLAYEKAEIRDAKFDALTKTLAEHNYELNEI